MMQNKTRVAFVCVHNACRSQIAEALGKLLAFDVFESCSAGTEQQPQINQDAVRLMRQQYGVDMEQNQYSKLLSELPPVDVVVTMGCNVQSVDVVVTMGCNVQCPNIPCTRREDWEIEDPTGKGDAAFIAAMQEIEKNIRRLKASLE